MKKTKYFLTLAASLFIFCSPLHAKEFKDMLPHEKGKVYFQNKDYEKAYISFHQAFMQDPTDLNISFFMGRAAFEQAIIARIRGNQELSQQRLEAALMAFDRVLIVQPGAIRVKLEMARCHMELGSLEIAKQLFYEVLDTNPPESVKKNIDLLLATIAASEKVHFISGMASLGVSFDNNVRSGPPAGTVTASFGILDFQADDPVKDQIFNNTAVVNHVYKFIDTPYSWKTSATFFTSLYEDYRDLDLAMLGISTGPAYQGERVILDASAHFNNIKLGWDEYVQPFGVGASMTFLFDPRVIITSSVTYEQKIYSKNSDESKDATNLVVNISPSLILNDNRFTFTVAKEQENANIGYWCYDKISWGLRYDRVLPDDFTAFVSLDTKLTDYHEANTPLTDTIARSDTVYVYTMGLSKIFWKSPDKSRNMSLQFTNTVTDSQSNIARSNYNKNVFASTLSYIF